MGIIHQSTSVGDGAEGGGHKDVKGTEDAWRQKVVKLDEEELVMVVVINDWVKKLIG